MKLITKIFAAFTFVLTPSALFAATSPVGSTPGSFAVGPSGAASYSIPIQVPPGINGMQPELSLEYNSQAGNGIAGVGWNIGGLSAITRCGATLDRDGVKGGVNLNAADKFCLDGQRLIAIAGVYGAEGTEYRTEIESFSKITSSMTLGTGPAHFVVTTRDGSTAQYGYSGDSRVHAQGGASVMSWALSEVRDTNFNTMKFVYTPDSVTTGEHRIQRIDYTYNVNTGLVIGGVTRSVKFIYAARADHESAYVGGGLTYSSQRLTNIQTFLSTSTIPVRDYRLTYQTALSPATNRSRLLSVQECGADGVCLQGGLRFRVARQQQRF